MPRVPLVPFDDLDPDDRAALGDVVAPGASVELFQAMAQRPAIVHTALEHMRVLMTEGVVPSDLKALIAVRVAQVNHCVY